MVTPNFVRLTILTNQLTVLEVNSENISMFKSKFYVNHITSLFIILKITPSKLSSCGYVRRESQDAGLYYSGDGMISQLLHLILLCEKMLLAYFNLNAQQKCGNECGLCPAELRENILR